MKSDEFEKQSKPPYKVNVLLGENGLDAIAKYFGNFKFRGKGHEIRDLRKLIEKYREWAFIMYPEMRFEDIVEKTQKFSSSGLVKSHLQKLRDKRDGVQVMEIEDEEQKNVDLPVNNGENSNNQNNNDNDANFDALVVMRGNRENNSEHKQNDANPNANNKKNANPNRNENCEMMDDRDIDYANSMY